MGDLSDADTDTKDEHQKLLLKGKGQVAMPTKEKATVSKLDTSVLSDTESDQEDQELLLNGSYKLAMEQAVFSNPGSSNLTDLSDNSEHDGQELFLNGLELAMSTKEALAVSEPETSDLSDTETESEVEDQKLLLNGKVATKGATITERMRVFLAQNYKKVAAIVSLWIAYLMCNMAISLIGPFFPQEVYIMWVRAKVKKNCVAKGWYAEAELM